jgi:hypothetical protein
VVIEVVHRHSSLNSRLYPLAIEFRRFAEEAIKPSPVFFSKCPSNSQTILLISAINRFRLKMDSREVISHRFVRATYLASGTCTLEVKGRYWCMIDRPSLIDDANCFETVRTLRRPDGVSCPPR